MFESGKESKIKTVEVTVQTGHASVPGVWSCPTSRMAHGGYFFCKIKFKKAGMSSAWTTQSVTLGNRLSEDPDTHSLFWKGRVNLKVK